MILNMLQGWVGESSIQTVMATKYMRENPELTHQALSVICQTMTEYVRESIRAGADGLFVTTSPFTRDFMTEEEYLTFGKPYEVPLFEAALEEGARLNILHICKDNIFFDIMLDYPVHLIQYENTSPRNPSLSEAMAKTEKAFWAGVNNRYDSPLVIGPIDAIVEEVHSALDETGGRRFALGPVCVFSPSTPEAHIKALKEAIYTWNALHHK
jgi:uroporphyrinogen-III decarboxylase